MRDRQKEYHKDKLQNEITSKMKTVMIGALASVENHFGELWGKGQNRALTGSEEKFQEVFMALRKEILDKGNSQIKAAKQLIDAYSVEYIGYTLELKLPVVRYENES